MAESPSRSYAVVVVFALGTVFGAALTVILLHFHGGMPVPFGRGAEEMHARHGPGEENQAVIEHMENELQLDDAQRRDIQTILDEAHTRIHGTLAETHAKIRALLRPDQQEKFDKMRPPDLPFPRRGDGPPRP